MQIQKYLLFNKKQKKTQIESQSYRDINYSVNKYIELIGSEEFSAYLKSILYNKLSLQYNSQFQAFITDLFCNASDLSITTKFRCIPLERFLILILQL